jgi:Protein of unknown function (DUF3108)
VRRLIALLAGFALIAAVPAQADRFALAFDGRALGLFPLGDIVLDFFVDQGRYEARATLRSSGLVSLFERTELTADSTGAIVDGQVRMDRYLLDHHYSKKHRTIDMRATAAGVTAAIEPNYRVWGEPPASDAQKQAARDPLSSMVAMALDVKREGACGHDYLTFDGRFLYRLELRGGVRDHVDAGGYDGPALRCTLRYVPVAGFEAHDAGRRRFPEGQIWFALAPDSELAPPVRIRLPLALGNAHIALARWQRPNVSIDPETP